MAMTPDIATTGTVNIDGANGDISATSATGIDMTTSGPIAINGNTAGTSGQVLTSGGPGCSTSHGHPLQVCLFLPVPETGMVLLLLVVGVVKQYLVPTITNHLLFPHCDVSGSPSMFSEATSGQFIAPVNGIYFLSASLCMQMNAHLIDRGRNIFH